MFCTFRADDAEKPCDFTACNDVGVGRCCVCRTWDKSLCTKAFAGSLKVYPWSRLFMDLPRQTLSLIPAPEALNCSVMLNSYPLTSVLCTFSLRRCVSSSNFKQSLELHDGTLPANS